MMSITPTQKSALRKLINSRKGVSSEERQQLADMGFFDDNGRVNIHGYHAANKYKNVPLIRKPKVSDWSRDKDRNLVIADDFMRGAQGALKANFTISVKDLMETYTSIVADANSIFEDTYWSTDMDLAAEKKPLSKKDINTFQNMALKKALNSSGRSGHFLEDISIPVAKAYLADRDAPHFRASESVLFAFEDSKMATQVPKIRRAKKIEAKRPISRDASSRKELTGIRKFIEMSKERVPTPQMV